MKVFLIFEQTTHEIYYGSCDEYTTYEADELCIVCANKNAVRAWFDRQLMYARDAAKHAITTDVTLDIREDFTGARIVAKAMWAEAATGYTIQECEVFDD